MPDYKKMYLELFSAVEDAINILVKAQQQAEDTYIETDENESAEE